MSYRVTGALVVAKDQGGHNRHYYRGAVIHYLNEVQGPHFLRKGLVEKIVEKAKPAPAAADNPAESTKPPKTAPVAAWVAYGVDKLGEEKRAELEALDKPELIQLLG